MAAKLKGGQYFGEYIKDLEYDFIRCNITRYEPSAIIGEHYHENPYLSLLLDGNYLEINKEGDTLVETGSIIYRPSSYTHSNMFRDLGGFCFNIEFKGIRGNPFHLKLSRENAIYKAGSLPQVYTLYHHFVNGTIAGLQREFITGWMDHASRKEPGKSLLPWVNKVEHILENEFEIHHTIQSISKRVFIHPVYLARAFKEETGFTPGDYQMKMKLEKSSWLLFNTPLPIHEIASRTGFFDTPHFIHSFQMVYRVSPSRFRKTVKS